MIWRSEYNSLLYEKSEFDRIDSNDWVESPIELDVTITVFYTRFVFAVLHKLGVYFGERSEVEFE